MLAFLRDLLATTAAAPSTTPAQQAVVVFVVAVVADDDVVVAAAAAVATALGQSSAFCCCYCCLVGFPAAWRNCPYSQSRCALLLLLLLLLCKLIDGLHPTIGTAVSAVDVGHFYWGNLRFCGCNLASESPGLISLQS